MVFFPLFFKKFLSLEKKKMPRESVWNKRAEAEGQKGSQKWKGRTRTWKKAPSLLCIFFFLYSCFFFSSTWEEKDARRKCLKQKGKSGSQKREGKVGIWRWTPSFLLVFFCCFLMCFVFFVFEKKKTMAMCHCLFLWCCCNGILLPSPSFLVVFKGRKQWQLVVVAFYLC